MCDINMSNQVKVSVLMTVFNTNFTYTKRAIDSVLKQDFTNFELIIIDDGSKENDRELLMDYVEKNEDKISYIRHSNRGQSESINRGIEVLALPTVAHLPTESAAPGPSNGGLGGQGMDLGTH